MRTTLCFKILLITLSVFLLETSFAAQREKRLKFSLLPGASRAISHSMSASRDTSLIAYQVLPHVATTTGGDFAFFGFEFLEMSLRLGLFGMFEFETIDAAPGNFLSVPSGPYLWRGLLGYSVAYSADGPARRLLGEEGALEATFAFRHESDHYIGSYHLDPSRFDGVPNIGDLFMLDVAARKGIGRVAILEIRAQNKFFLKSGTSDAYAFGPGGDLICRFPVLRYLHPFVSVFGEYLFARERIRDGRDETAPDNFLVSGLAGVIVPGTTADLQIYLATSYGHGKGLLAFEKEGRIGWGMRIVLFKKGLAYPRTSADARSRWAPHLATRR